MSYKRWEIYFALVPYQDKPEQSSRHPILIWNDSTAFVISFKMTSTDRGSKGMEYRLIEWEAAGLDHATSVRLDTAVRIERGNIQERVGEIQPADKLNIQKKLISGK